MSKLLEKLEKISQGIEHPMGFGLPRVQQRVPSMLLVADLSKASADLVKSVIDKGADALVIRINNSDEAAGLAATVAAAGNIPCGVALASADAEALKKLEDIGVDFLVFQGKDSTTDVLRNEKVAKAIEVEASLEDSLLEAICDLPIDAVLLRSGPESSLTIHQLMVYQRFVNILNRPLIVAVPPTLKESDLEFLRDIGVAAILLSDSMANFEERIQALRQGIEALPSNVKKKRNKVDVFLPSVRGQSSVFDEDEEEE